MLADREIPHVSSGICIFKEDAWRGSALIQSNELLRLNISGRLTLCAISDSLTQCFIEMLEFRGCARRENPLVGGTGPAFKHLIVRCVRKISRLIILDLDAILVFLFLIHKLSQVNRVILVDIRQWGTQESFKESRQVYTNLEVAQRQVASNSPILVTCYRQSPSAVDFLGELSSS